MSRSMSSWVEKSCVELAQIAFLVCAKPKVGPAAICLASALTVGIKSASSTHFQIRPQASACSAGSFSPSIARPIARAGPSSRGKTQVPPVSGISPSLQKA